MYGLRIKVKSDATSGGVSDVTYSGNTVTGIAKYGLLITQSYSDDFGTPGTATTIRYAFPFSASVFVVFAITEIVSWFLTLLKVG